VTSSTSTNFLSALGAGSGIDSKALATSLANLEIQPRKDLIQEKLTKTENKISGYSAVLASLANIKTAFQTLENPSSVIPKIAQSSQSNVISVSTTAGAIVGNHSIEVTQLAQAQRSMSGGFASATEALNGGNPFTLQLSVDGESAKTIRIPALASTPEGMALAINSSGLGLSANIINTGDGTASPYRLVITGETGASKNFTLTADDGSGVGETQILRFGPPTQSGNINVAGVTVAVELGDTAADVAQKVATALASDSIVTGTLGRSVSVTGIGEITFQYAASDGQVSDILFTDSDTTGTTFNVASSTDFTLGSPVSGVTFTTDATHMAQDAELVVDGLSVKRASNEIKDLFTGVNLNLLGTTTTPAQVTISRETSELKTKLSDLITAYNNAISDFKILTGPKNTTDETDIYSGSLKSDSTVSYVVSSIRNIFLRNSSTASGGISAFRDIGVTFQRDGTFSLDDTVLDNVLASDPDSVVAMLTANKENKTYYGSMARGLAGDAIKSLNDMIASTGQLNTQTTNANSQIAKYKDQLAALDERLTLIQTRYIKQFAVMDSMVGQTNTLKTNLESTFAGMMAAYTNKN
jgi:flagellar hook-associated protein 2